MPKPPSPSTRAERHLPFSTVRGARWWGEAGDAFESAPQRAHMPSGPMAYSIQLSQSLFTSPLMLMIHSSPQLESVTFKLFVYSPMIFTSTRLSRLPSNS